MSGGFAWSVLFCPERGCRLTGRSHGPGCAAVSLIGAIQWCSLQDSLGRPRAAKSAYMVRSLADEVLCLYHAHSMGEWNLDRMSLLTSALPTALHCRFFRDDDALECTEQFFC
jgi:hypothetical protein